MQDIPEYQNWKSIEPLEGGFSKDEKYKVTTSDGQTQLLILAESIYAQAKLQQYSLLRQLKEINGQLPIPDTLKYGFCEDGASFYQLLSWVPGRLVLDLIPELSSAEAEKLGHRAGELLLQLHSAGAKIPVNDVFGYRYDLKKVLERKINMYNESGMEIRDDGEIIECILENYGHFQKAPAILLHGDFHLGNLVLGEDGRLWAIDFNRVKAGPALLDFARLMVYSQPVSPEFCNGLVDEYAAGAGLPDFRFGVQYFALVEAFFNVQWAMAYGDDAVNAAKKSLKRIWRDIC